jgi:hypothetical protein
MKIIKRILLALGFVLAGMLLALAALMYFTGKRVTLDTRMELVVCAVAAQDYRKAQGRWPESHGQIDAKVSTELGMGGGGRADEWGRPFLFTSEPQADQAVLQTYGEDGKPGTRDGDLRVVVTPNQLTVFSE